MRSGPGATIWREPDGSSEGGGRGQEAPAVEALRSVGESELQESAGASSLAPHRWCPPSRFPPARRYPSGPETTSGRVQTLMGPPSYVGRR